jgi:hypothetical protein
MFSLPKSDKFLIIFNHPWLIFMVFIYQVSVIDSWKNLKNSTDQNAVCKLDYDKKNPGSICCLTKP